MSTLRVLYEDNHLLVVDKPAGVATMGTTPNVPTMARVAAEYLKVKYQKPGKVFVGVVSRLDSLVSGVLVLARTSKSASRISEQIRNQTPTKRYLALVEGHLQATDWLQLNDWVVKDESQQRMKIVTHVTPTEASTGERGARENRAQQASLRVKSLASTRAVSLVEVDLETGRKHQIRLQLSAAGHAVLGDRKYGAARKFPAGIGLHCFQLTILHPTLRTPMTFTSFPGEAWQRAAPEVMKTGLSSLSERQNS